MKSKGQISKKGEKGRTSNKAQPDLSLSHKSTATVMDDDYSRKVTTRKSKVSASGSRIGISGGKSQYSSKTISFGEAYEWIMNKTSGLNWPWSQEN